VSVVAYYPRMPLANSAFGPRTVEVCVPAEEAPGCPGRRGEEVCDVQTIEVFWPLFQDVAAGLECLREGISLGASPQTALSCMRSFASNHPGPDSTIEDHCPSGTIFVPQRASNWFHYWLQVLSPLLQVSEIGVFHVGYLEAPIGRNHNTFGAFLSPQCWPTAMPNNQIGIFPMSGVLQATEGDGEEVLFGILAMLATLAHESAHHANYLQYTLEGRGLPIFSGELVSETDWSRGVDYLFLLYNHFFDLNGDRSYTKCTPLEGTRYCGIPEFCDIIDERDLPCCPDRFLSESETQMDWNGDGILSEDIAVHGCDIEHSDTDQDDVPNWLDPDPNNRAINDEAVAEAKELEFMSGLPPDVRAQVRSLDWGCPGIQCESCTTYGACRLMEVE
jgi:hypothetical protein